MMLWNTNPNAVKLDHSLPEKGETAWKLGMFSGTNWHLLPDSQTYKRLADWSKRNTSKSNYFKMWFTVLFEKIVISVGLSKVNLMVYNKSINIIAFINGLPYLEKKATKKNNVIVNDGIMYFLLPFHEVWVEVIVSALQKVHWTHILSRFCTSCDCFEDQSSSQFIRSSMICILTLQSLYNRPDNKLIQRDTFM